MPEWLHQHAWWMTTVSVAIFLLATIVGGWAVIRMPSDYFNRPSDATDPFRRHHPAVRSALIVGKNVLGAMLVVVGLVLSLPLVPGPGVVTVLVGLSLLDIPGKRKCERWLVGRRIVLAPLNRLRAVSGRPPLQPPAGPADRKAADEPARRAGA